MEKNYEKLKKLARNMLTGNAYYHIFDWHGAKVSKEMLLERLNKDKKDFSTRFAFTVPSCIDNLIVNTICNEEGDAWKEVVDWLNDDTDDEIYVCFRNFKRIVGYGYCKQRWCKWSHPPYACTSVEVVLAKDYDRYGKMIPIIKTAYPSFFDT